jgi:ABC-type nickel/cobalt efflux system permease component RcnA
MRRWALCVATLLALALPAVAQAHPLGNFTVNQQAQVAISDGRVDVRWVLDKAEIPTFQDRRLSAEQLLGQVREEGRRGLTLVVDGREVALREVASPRIAFLPGQGGLKTTRVELTLRAPVDGPSRVELGLQSFPDRQGWRAIVPLAGEGTAVRTDVPSGDPTDGLRTYPQAILGSPPDQRMASFAVEPGDGTLVAPPAPGQPPQRAEADETGSGFAGVFAQAAGGEGVLVFLLLAALAWGALHALSPGHGKAMVAAYLVGTRGTARHAVALGGVVTATHTVGVFALGLVTLALSQYVLPEDLYPWLTLVSGLMVVVIGAGVLRSRVRAARRARGHGAHGHDHGPHHDHGHQQEHHGHAHEHGHHHHVPDELSWKGVLGMGAAAGLIPCPSALVVLLAAVAQQQVALGMLLIVAFSVGLATTLIILGVLVVSARGVTGRLRIPSRVIATLPAVSALIIMGAGCMLTAQAVPQIV